MIADVVVDLQYGDCGKGKVTHHLLKSGEYTHCIRYNGGCNAGHTIFHNGVMVGRATSGCYGHSIEKSLALAYVLKEHADIGTELEIEILGERRPAYIINESPCDPENLKLRT